ncbi:MAG: type II secretion system F family protein [Nitrospinae bacterium]|nr:type II secretion system F family protein [Nitrospinota bacterium]
MATFTYKARTKTGQVTLGDLAANTKAEATTLLMQKGLIPTQVEEKKEGGGGNISLSLGDRFEKVGIEEIIVFTSQFATLFKAGIPMTECIGGLIEQADTKKFKMIIADIKARVEEGAALNEALARHRDLFSETYVNMVMAGEVSGTLDVSLARLTKMLETQFETQNKIKEVLRYPKIVTGAITIAVTVLMTLVVPKFIVIFEKANIALPLPTRILIAISHGFQHYWYIGIAVIVGVVFLFKRYTNTAIGRHQWHKFTVQAPIFGNIMLKLTLAQFCQVLASLLKSGVPILQSIEVASRTAGNDFLSKIFIEVGESVRDGSGMAGPLGKHKIMPTIVVQMIAAGENSGALDDMLLKVTDYFMAEADRKIKGLSSLIEPIMIVSLGSIVLFIALAIFLPMWDMTKMAH